MQSSAAASRRTSGSMVFWTSKQHKWTPKWKYKHGNMCNMSHLMHNLLWIVPYKWNYLPHGGCLTHPHFVLTLLTFYLCMKRHLAQPKVTCIRSAHDNRWEWGGDVHHWCAPVVHVLVSCMHSFSYSWSLLLLSLWAHQQPGTAQILQKLFAYSAVSRTGCMYT